jgi:hypothetical protein
MSLRAAGMRDSPAEVDPLPAGAEGGARPVSGCRSKMPLQCSSCSHAMQVRVDADNASEGY